jgi:Mrp family chromosome partitioning ATPase
MANEGSRPRVVLVTSAIPNDGKSMTASNLAIIAGLGRCSGYREIDAAR